MWRSTCHECRPRASWAVSATSRQPRLAPSAWPLVPQEDPRPATSPGVALCAPSASELEACPWSPTLVPSSAWSLSTGPGCARSPTAVPWSSSRTLKSVS